MSSSLNQEVEHIKYTLAYFNIFTFNMFICDILHTCGVKMLNS